MYLAMHTDLLYNLLANTMQNGTAEEESALAGICFIWQSMGSHSRRIWPGASLG